MPTSFARGACEPGEQPKKGQLNPAHPHSCILVLCSVYRSRIGVNPVAAAVCLRLCQPRALSLREGVSELESVSELVPWS